MHPRTLIAAPILLFSLACSGDMFRSCTSAVVGKTVETTKEVSKGVADGIEEGRKAGESMDGAHIVSSMAELSSYGGAAVYAINAGDAGAEVVLAFENTGDTPVRVTGLEVAALDVEGFVQHPLTPSVQEVTVPPRAKERATFRFTMPAESVGTVRLWGEDLELPTP